MRVRLRGEWTDAPDAPQRVFLSACMMVGAEAEFLGDAIASVRDIADEVVVLDTRGDADTVAIATAAGARVTSEPWRTVDLGDGLRSVDDFGACRNRAFSLASPEANWWLVLDADERLSAPLLRRTLSRLPLEVDGITLPVDHVERPELFAPMLKLFRASPTLKYINRCHETVDPWMKTECRAIADLPPDLAMVRHVGASHETRARLRRDERNRKLLEIMLREDPDSVHALAYMATMITENLNA
jgi:glycosyltransferase involved in cell wall biosynthesis